MKRACLLAAALALAAGSASARDLTVVSFGGALQDAVKKAWVEPFGKATGRPVTMDTYNGSLSLIRAQVDAKAVTWDVVELESNDVLQGCQEGYLERIDWAKVGNRDNLIPPGGTATPCGAGIFTGALVMSYDRDKMPEGPKTWADFWNVAKFPGQRGMGSDPKRSLEIATMADGVPPSKVYDVLRTPAGIDRAFRKLDELKPHIKWYKLGAEAIQLMSSGEVAMTTAFNGRVIAANRTEKRKFDLVWGAGAIYFVEYFGIVKGTPNLAAATDFVRFSLEPDNQRAFPDHIGYGPANTLAYKGMKPDIAKDLMTPEQVKDMLERDDSFWADNNDELTQRFNVWAAR